MASPREIVVTGLGIVSPIGIGREAFQQSLEGRVSGVAAIRRYDTSALPVRIGAELKDFDPKLYVKPRKSLKVMSREIQMGVASATLAVEDAQLNTEDVVPERFGVVYGSPMIYGDIPELQDIYRSCLVDGKFDFTCFGEQFQKQMLPLWMLKYLPNMTASHIGIAHGARGPNNSVVQGDVSSLLAMIEATSVIQRGLADVMLTGGAGSRLDFTGVMYRGDSNLSHQNDRPATASRPFDVSRDGMVIGEGAATIVLESRLHAERRGAPILGTVLSFATTHAGTDGLRAAIARSISSCLSKASIAANQIGHVNAHGLSQIEHDITEAEAIRSTLDDVPVTAPKSYFGNVGAASGALEISASLTNGSIPATLNYEQPDQACDIRVVTEQRKASSTVFLKLGQTGTGQAAAMLLRREE